MKKISDCIFFFSLFTRYTTQPSMLLYPFQLFGLLSQHQYTHKVFSICSTRCELILCLFLSVNCSTINPFAYTLNRLMLTSFLSLLFIVILVQQIFKWLKKKLVVFHLILFMNWLFVTWKNLLCMDWLILSYSSILFYHLLHKVPSFLEFVIAKSEYPFIPKLMSISGIPHIM